MIWAAKPDLVKTLEPALWCVLVLALFLLGIWVVALIRSRYRGREDHAATAHLMLSQLGELHREGDLTDDEFRSIKNRLIDEIDGGAREPDVDGEEEKSG